jgi:SAM-dependent methyltransferase
MAHVDAVSDTYSAQAVLPPCRFCNAPLQSVFADLGMSPLANSYLGEEELATGERYYPLRALVCDECLLVQLPAAAAPEEIFSDYAYFSGYSTSWVEHARRYADQVCERFGLDERSRVVEVASNDGYLLQHFLKRGIPVLGIEPAANVARAAEAIGIPTVVEFLSAESGARLRAEGHSADLLVGNNVLAHVPDLHSFVAGLKALLAPQGVLTMEFPHLLRLMEETQFDTIYHEHFSYFSLLTVERVFAAHELTVFDVEELPTHGGSLRVYVRNEDDESHPDGARVAALRLRELDAGLGRLGGYTTFGDRVLRTKLSVLDFALSARREGKTVVGYGAAAKGTTLLNYCGLGRDFVDYVVDRSPHKQGRYLPGTRIPIHDPSRIDETRPDYLLLLAWNLRDEIIEQMAHVRDFGCRFVTPVPVIRVLE